MHLRSLTTISALLLLASTALAEPDAATKAKARDMGLEGLTMYDNGDYAGALAKFDQAYGMYPAPTLGVYAARALAKLGKLTEASQRYQQVIQMKLSKDASEQFRQAQTDAENERAALIQRIPRLRVEVAGGGDQTTSVSVDGAAVAAADLGSGVSLNPGAHDVRGQRGQEVVSMNVALQEGETKTVTLEFKPAAAPEVTPPPPPPQGPSSPPPPMAPLRDSFPRAGQDTGSGKRTFGYVLLGVGGVGLGVGAISGLMATGKKSDLEKVCRDLDHCPESSRSDVDQYNTLRTVSTIGFVAGGIGLAGGALLLITAPSAKEQSARVSPWVGVGSVGMRGRF